MPAEPATKGKSSEFLGTTTLRVDWLQERLLEACSVKTRSKIVSCESHQIGAGQGFLSLIIKCTLTWEPTNQDLPKQVVVKTPTSQTISDHMNDFMKEEDEEDKAKMDDLMKDVFIPIAHKNECTFYDMFRASCPVPIPKTYYCREITKRELGVIIMEDLSDRCFCVNIADGLRLEQIKSITKHMAAFHAQIIQNFSQDDYSEYSVQGKETFDEFPVMFKTIKTALIEAKEEWFKDSIEKIEWAFDADYIYHSMLKSHEDVGVPPILVHGDMWTNNIFFRPDDAKDNGGSDDVLSFLDWQVAHKGNLAEDLARVLCSSSSSQIRREHADELFEYYHQCLSENLPDGKVPFTVDDVKRAYQRIMPYASVFFMFGVPMMINSPVVQSDPAKSERRRLAMLERARDLVQDMIAMKLEE